MAKWTLRGVVLSGLLLASASLQAHHSLAGMYALGKEAKVTGAFKAFRLVNPHSSMKLDVKNPDGTTTEWSFVGGSVTSLARLGIGSGFGGCHGATSIRSDCPCLLDADVKRFRPGRFTGPRQSCGRWGPDAS